MNTAWHWLTAGTKPAYPRAGDRCLIAVVHLIHGRRTMSATYCGDTPLLEHVWMADGGAKLTEKEVLAWRLLQPFPTAPVRRQAQPAGVT